MVNVTNEDLYVEIKNLTTEIKKLTSLLENDDAKEISTNNIKPENTDRYSVITDLSRVGFNTEREAVNFLKSYGFEQIPHSCWYENNKLHLSCYIKMRQTRNYTWKISFTP